MPWEVAFPASLVTTKNRMERKIGRHLFYVCGTFVDEKLEKILNGNDSRRSAAFVHNVQTMNFEISQSIDNRFQHVRVTTHNGIFGVLSLVVFHVYRNRSMRIRRSDNAQESLERFVQQLKELETFSQRFDVSDAQIANQFSFRVDNSNCRDFLKNELP